MTKIHFGERIGRYGELRVGCSAVILDPTRTKVLLTRRSDNGMWCLPGGTMNSGESVVEACEREVWEETGLRVHATRLTGVYSNPHQLVEYADGNKCQFVALNFEVEILSGTPALSDETTEVGFFSFEEVKAMELMGRHKERIFDVLAGQEAAFVR
jgi:ADP-ribose pyrophosphatase YjhB (NUDIX family)